ncbi:XRE family transcriptional regulator [Streptomyces sp. NPDC004647]|uniref:helix-turn-helix domain-containing protein n=1 Tax=Streptomyces sp. NPDC004647 TaxID=3154671 RepID=UPI0033A17D51
MAAKRKIEEWGPEQGKRLAAARNKEDLTQKQLADLAEISRPYLSNLERGVDVPSVGTLQSLCAQLHVTDDSVLFGIASNDPTPVTAAAAQPPLATTATTVVRKEGQRVIDLEHGVRWGFNAGAPGHAGMPRASSKDIVYEPGGASTRTGYMRHPGWELGRVISGTLDVLLEREQGTETHVLNAGDSISYDSSTPHRLVNRGDETVTALWIEIEYADHQPTPP